MQIESWAVLEGCRLQSIIATTLQSSHVRVTKTRPSAHPGEESFAEKDSRQINMLEQILIAKVFNFGGICSDGNNLAAERCSPAEPEVGSSVSLPDSKCRSGDPAGDG